MAMRRLFHRCSMLLAVQALLVPAVHAQCRTATAPPNVVLLVADDFGWSDLPFFNPPINWKDGTPVNTRQYRDVRPELNRLAARLIAKRENPLQADPEAGELGTFARDPFVPGETAPDPYPVVPLDATPDPANHVYSHLPSCAPNMANCPNDVLKGFGGLRELSQGLTFSRFYAASAICASTRATIFSGRYPQRTGVHGNGGRLQPDEVTIAEHLIQGCPGQACFGWRDSGGNCCMVDPSGGACETNQLAPCYRTGLIGKWHLGEDEGRTTPWDQGFTEYVGHPRGCCRGHFSRSPLTCSPGPGGAPLYVGAENGGTCTSSVVSSRECCDSENRYYVPGRGDRGGLQGTFPCNDDVNEPECSEGSSNAGDPCDADSDCPGGFCWRGGYCLSGNSVDFQCNTDVQCADASCEESCEPADCKTGCFYEHKCGCNYGTRAYRDLALNFIRRHCDEPFFLTITFNATHIGHNAPHRTASHYRTDGVGSRNKFWGAVEELDAAAGRIVDELTTLGLADNTLVLFTADQGRPGGNYGDPTLRGGKGGVFDGGIRIGLLGRSRSGDSYGLDDLDAHLGSHVDILPTIAEAAGFPLSALPTQNVFGTCADNRGCPADCPTESCNRHYVDGRSFYGLLTGAADPGPTPTPARDLTFASYGGIAVVARRGLVPTPTPGARMCGYVDENADHIAIRGGSCVSCGATCPSTTRCQILGKVCVATDGGTCRAPNGFIGTVDPTPCTSNRDCDVGNTCVHPTPTGGFERCRTGCSGQGRVCAEVHVDCNECLDAAWKLKSGDGEGQPLPTACSLPLEGAETDALYDLATNPEEQASLDCKEAVPNIWCDLKRKLLNWDDCAADADCEGESCEGLATKPSCAQP
jgi:hypothetical protein